MKRKPGGHKNAFKHGAFARDLILTGETREDFERLHESLIEEWKPKGALEEDTVLTLAQGIWLKRRVERFYHQEATWAEEHPGEEELNYVDSLTRMLDHVQSFEGSNRVRCESARNVQRVDKQRISSGKIQRRAKLDSKFEGGDAESYPDS